MSVLVQRPHQVPGLITIQRHHAKQLSPPRRAPAPLASSPRVNHRKPQQQRQRQPPAAFPLSTPVSEPTTAYSRSSKRRSAPPLPAANPPTSDPSPVSSFNPTTVLAPSIQDSAFASFTPSHPNTTSNSATLTTSTTDTPHPTPLRTAPSTPVPAPRSNRRTPPPSDVAHLRPNDLPSIPSPSPAAKRTRRNNVPSPGAVNPSPSLNVKQGKKRQPAPAAIPAQVRSGSVSLPASPATVFPQRRHAHNHAAAAAAAHPPIAALELGPALNPRPVQAHHSRAPSHPTFPAHRGNDAFTNHLDTLFDSALILDERSSTLRPRGASVSASMPGSMGIHTRMMQGNENGGRRERTLTASASATFGNNGRGFAGASFQHAPDAMTMPRPGFGSSTSSLFGKFAGSRSSLSLTSGSEDPSSASEFESDRVVDLGEDDDFIM